MTEFDKNTPSSPTTSPNNVSKLFADLFVCILIPTLILKKMSGADSLGPILAFVLAISLPLGMAIYEMVTQKKIGFVAALGFISILLTGGIGLLKLPKEYIAYKEALIPSAFALACIISNYTSKPLVRLFLYNDTIMDTGRVAKELHNRGQTAAFDASMKKATLMLSGSFVMSAILNFVLAKTIIVSNTGSEAFNSELGTMNLLSYPVIVVPCMIVTIYTLFYVMRNIKELTGLKMEQVIRA